MMQQTARRYRPRFVFYMLMAAVVCTVLLQQRAEPKESRIVVKEEGTQEYMQVYLMEEDKLLVPLSLAVSKEEDTQGKIALLMGYLSGKQPLSGFHSFFSKQDVLDGVTIEEETAVLQLNDAFLSYEKEDELRLLEAIAWGVTQFNGVSSVKLQLQGQTLTEMPLGHTPIPSVLDRSIGINHFETSTAALHDSATLLVYGTKKIDGVQYLIPRSRRVDAKHMETLDDQVAAVVADLSASSTLKSTMAANEAAVQTAENGVLHITVSDRIYGSDRTLKQDDVNELVLSLGSLEGVKGLQLTAQTQKVARQDDTVYTIDQLVYNIVNRS